MKQRLCAGFHKNACESGALGRHWVPPPNGLKNKDLCGIPWRVAFALQADGWFLRSDIIWHKPNPMPESITDRPTKAHEYIFLLSKSARYFYDAEAIKERATGGAHSRGQGVHHKVAGRATGDCAHTAIAHNQPAPSHNGSRFGRGEKLAVAPNTSTKPRMAHCRPKQNESFSQAVTETVEIRNKRSVWTVPTEAYKEAHFATYPTALIKPCIMAGCPAGGVVLDPFGGAGTTGLVALELGRSALLCELNPVYVALIDQRLAHKTVGMGF